MFGRRQLLYKEAFIRLSKVLNVAATLQSCSRCLATAFGTLRAILFFMNTDHSDESGNQQSQEFADSRACNVMRLLVVVLAKVSSHKR